jgi:hypothetical protein
MPPSTLELPDVDAGVLLHRLKYVAGLVRDGFERGAGEVAAIRVAREPRDDAARRVAPVRREQARERGDDINVAVVVDGARERLDLGALRGQSQVVAQPLHERAGDGDRALECVTRRLVAELLRHRRDQSRR